MPESRFMPVQLTFNIGGARGSCKPGGSYICEPDTKTCDANAPARMTCALASCHTGNSTNMIGALEAELYVEESEVSALQGELARMLSKFAK
jgi:hypothetical protein